MTAHDLSTPPMGSADRVEPALGANGPTQASAARAIGPIGTGVRILGGLALLTLAYLDQPAGWIGGLEPYELLLGLVAFPTVSLAFGFFARRYSAGPLRFTGPAGTAVNLAVLIVLFANPYTASAAALFYGATLLVAAWRGQAGCEATVLPNVILGRDDQVGCPTLTPIDEIEARLGRPASHRASDRV